MSGRVVAGDPGPHGDEQGEVRWDVSVLDQDDVLVASYELLTMVSVEPR